MVGPVVLAGAAAGLLHGGLIPAMAILAALTFVGMLATHRPLRPGWAAAMAFATLTFCVYSSAMLLWRYGYHLSDGVAVASDHYQRLLDSRYDARTQYQGLIALPGRANEMLRIGVRLFQYMAEPLPWRVQNLGDAGVLAENLLRLLLIALATLAAVTNRQRRAVILVLLLSYFCLEGTWSLGTAAWGTAVRHHLPGLGLLLACAAAAVRRAP